MVIYSCWFHPQVQYSVPDLWRRKWYRGPVHRWEQEALRLSKRSFIIQLRGVPPPPQAGLSMQGLHERTGCTLQGLPIASANPLPVGWGVLAARCEGFLALLVFMESIKGFTFRTRAPNTVFEEPVPGSASDAFLTGAFFFLWAEALERTNFNPKAFHLCTT